MPITDWPVEERPREKLLHFGPERLSDAELLAIFIRTGTRGHSAVDIARSLLKSYDGLRPLLEAAPDSLCRQAGMGPGKYAQLQAALELGRRYLQAGLRQRNVLSCPEDTRAFLNARLRAHPREVFACLFLDNRHRVITFEELFFGTLDGASVHPREVLRRVMQHNAAAVILAHNHPSGVAEPSQADRHITERLQAVLGLIDVRVLDHLVVGEATAVSFAERGWI
jgi:DNA repair protein RadC